MRNSKSSLSHQKWSNLPVILMFFVMILAVPVYWLARGNVGQINSLIEYRTMADFPPLPMQDIRTASKRVFQGLPSQAVGYLSEHFIKRGYQIKFETAVSDQMPFRATAILLSNTLDRIYINLAYALLYDPAIPADMRNHIYQMRDDNRLIIQPVTFGMTDMEEIDKKVEYYNALISNNPDVNYYLLYIDLIETSPYNPLNPYFTNTDSGKSFAYFEANKPEGLYVGRLAINSYEEYKKNFFRSDHHWNIHGTLAGYEIMYNMIAQNYPGVSPMHSIDETYIFPDIHFHGSWSRTAYFPIQPADVFEVAKFTLPPYKVYDKYGAEIDYNKHDEYFNGKYSTMPFIDHYNEYHGSDQVDLIEYVFENGASKNLLLVGDSFANPFEPIIASHYHHTYSLDPRRWKGVDLSLEEFRQDHQVDDVIIVGGPTITIYRGELTLAP